MYFDSVRSGWNLCSKQDKDVVYLNTQVFVSDSDDQFGNRASVSVNQTKEQREKNEPKIYLGNLKQVWEGDVNGSNKPNTQQQNNSSKKGIIADDDLPF